MNINELQRCIVSNHILKDGLSVGFCYREEMNVNFNDSGWRFFAGDETPEYMKNPNNAEVVTLREIIEIDCDVLKLLDAPINRAFARDDNGNFVEVENFF